MASTTAYPVPGIHPDVVMMAPDAGASGSGGPERGREQVLQDQIEGDTAQGPVVKVKKAPAAPSTQEWEEHLASGHASYRGWCPFCVAGKGKSEAHRQLEADRDHGMPALHFDYAYLGREGDDRATPILVGRFTKDRWLVTRPVPVKGARHPWVVNKLVQDVVMSGVTQIVIKSDQEPAILDLKNAVMKELKKINVEGPIEVQPEESAVGSSSSNAVIERSVWEMQSTTRALIAYAEWVNNCTFETGDVILSWAVEYSGQIVSRFQRHSNDGKTSYELRKMKSYRKAVVPFGELVMFMPAEKPKDKGEQRNMTGVMLGLVDRSDEIIVGTKERTVKARTVHRMPSGQRGDAQFVKSIKGVPWQPNPRDASQEDPLPRVHFRCRTWCHQSSDHPYR